MVVVAPGDPALQAEANHTLVHGDENHRSGLPPNYPTTLFRSFAQLSKEAMGGLTVDDVPVQAPYLRWGCGRRR